MFKIGDSWVSDFFIDGRRFKKSWGPVSQSVAKKKRRRHQRVTFGVDIPKLMVCFNHSTQRQTLDYLCIQPEEIKDVYQNEL